MDAALKRIYHFSFAKVINFQWGSFVTDIWSKFFLLRVKIVHLVDRSELFKFVVWFVMEEKLQRVSIAAYMDREFYGGYSELTISMFVSVKIDGLGMV